MVAARARRRGASSSSSSQFNAIAIALAAVFIVTLVDVVPQARSQALLFVVCTSMLCRDTNYAGWHEMNIQAKRDLMYTQLSLENAESSVSKPTPICSSSVKCN